MAFVIHDGNAHEFTDGTVHDGEVRRCGAIPRPPGIVYGTARQGLDIPLVPQGEWSSRIAQKTAEKSWLRDLRDRGNNGQRIPSRDQNGRGYCWVHSGVGAMLLCRARDNQPYLDLSAYGPACKVKNFRDEGGWGAQGVDFLTNTGCPTSKTWPQQGTDRSLDNPTTWAEAGKYKVDEAWNDLSLAQYDRNLTFAQVVTCLLANIPVVLDFNWWGHSVVGASLKDGVRVFNDGELRLESGKLPTVQEFGRLWGMNDPVTAGTGVTIWNSWGDSWGDAGMGDLSASKSVPDGSVAVRSVSAAA